MQSINFSNTIKQQSSADLVSQNAPSDLLIPEPYLLEDKAVGDTLTNESSIVAVVLWKSPIRITHYFAGDAEWKKELKVAKWIVEAKEDGKQWQTPCVKLR